MRRFIIIVASLVVMAITAVGAGDGVQAGALYVYEENGDGRVSSDTVVDGSAYIVGQTVRVSGTVRGDLYCGGNSIVVDGIIEGDVICAGGTVTVDGNVAGDVRVAAMAVTLDGAIDGNVSVFASDVRASESLVVAGDLNGATSTITIDGSIGRDIAIGADSMIVNGTVGRDITATLQSISFGEGASIGGSLTYTSPAEAAIPSGVVAGDTNFNRDTSRESYQAEMTRFFFFAIVAIALLVMLGTALMPRQVHAIGAVSWGTFGLAVVTGVTAAVFVPIIILLLIATGVGAYAAYVLLLLWLLVMALSPISFAYFLGTNIYGARSNNILVRATFGALALMVALSLPILNIFVFLIMVVAGAGLFMLRLMSSLSSNAYQIPKTETKKKRTSS